MVRQLARHARGARSTTSGCGAGWISSTSRRASTASPPSTPRARASAPPRPPAARCRTGSCIENNKIKNYQVVTPTAWNIGPRDGSDVLGPMEKALGRLADRRSGGPGGTRSRGPQLRLLPGVHRARLRRQDRQGAVEVRHQRNGVTRRSIGEHESRSDPGGSISNPPSDIEPPGCAVLIVGCGNLLRGDDGVGPVLVRHLWDRGVPDGARLVDGGTAGHGRRLPDARRPAGRDRRRLSHRRRTRHDLPGAGGGTGRPAAAAGPAHPLVPLGPRHRRSPAGRWATPARPTSRCSSSRRPAMDLGAELSEPVSAAMEQVIDLIERDYLAPLRPADRRRGQRRVHRRRLPADGRRAGRRPVSRPTRWRRCRVTTNCGCIPLRGPSSGGLLLKQRNPAGDRAVLVREVLG